MAAVGTQPEHLEDTDEIAVEATSVQASAQRRRSGPRASARVLEPIERALGLTRVGLGVTAVTLLFWISGNVVGSRGLVMAAYGLATVVVIAWVLGRRKLSIATDRSDVPSRVRARKPIDVQVKLTAKRRISGIIVEEQLDPHLGTPVRVAIPVLPSGQSVVHEYGFTPTQRGVYKLGPLVAEWSDPFGLTRRRQQLAPSLDVIVHPNSEPILDRITSREWEDPPIRPPVSKPWPTGFEFYGMREYVHGDDPRRIVWRAVAQYDKYLVREAEQGITDRVNIYLDTDAETHSRGPDSETFELGVRVAASLATKHLKDGFSVSLELNSESRCKAFRGEPKLIPLLDELARVEPERAGLEVALDRLFSESRRTAHNVVITPHLSLPVAARLRLLLDRGTSLLLVHVLWDDTDPLSQHRAAGLGCHIVNVSANLPLQTLFAHVVSARR